MPRRKTEEIMHLIDHMQSGLVELFDQFRELRRLLDVADDSEPAISEEPSTSPSIFTGVADEKSIGSSEKSPPPVVLSTDSSPISETEATLFTPESTSSPFPSEAFSSTVESVLAAFANNVQSGEAMAQNLALHLEKVKSSLITKEHPNDRVERDMDIVLRFLKKRGGKGIRPEERDNILKRIQRWKAHLTVEATRGE